ncbi:hypothetical protein JXJ21_04325 [candidate division KSB1 bacterium]|nr:hypothetical protein [candidate division KSB1 bacterium]
MTTELKTKESERNHTAPNLLLAGSDRQKTIQVKTLNHPNFELRQPLVITVQEDRQNIIANYNELDSFGCGCTESEAVVDLLNEIIETYVDLESEEKALQPTAKRLWNHLQNVVVRK